MVLRSSQWMSTIPPASPVAFINRLNSGAQASNEGMHMKIFMLDWPASTAGRTSATSSGPGVSTTAWKKTSAIACRATSADSARTRSAIVSQGRT